LTIIVPEMECQPNVVLRINGERREVPAGLSVLDLLALLGLDPQRVAVELDRRIVRRTQWDSTAVLPGASLEIVQFVGGG
jgi:thiamine biosynthesis protein ThiS